MSRIYFHAEDREAEVFGSERGLMIETTADRTHYALRNIQDEHIERTYAILAPEVRTRGSWAMKYPREYRSLFTGSGIRKILEWNGVRFSPFPVMLNTLTRTGHDDLILLALIHGTCEAHGWIDGPDRAWFASKIDHALGSGILRENHGWNDVISLLNDSDEGEVVMSYSITGGFPSLNVTHLRIDWDDYAAYRPVEKKWENLGRSGRWAAGMEALRGNGTLQISPARWGSSTFVLNFAAQDLAFDDWETRLDKAVAGPLGQEEPWG